MQLSREIGERGGFKTEITNKKGNLRGETLKRARGRRGKTEEYM